MSVMPRRKTIAWLVFATCVVWIGVRWAVASTRPTHRLGVRNGQLDSCPDRPNCVSTRATDAGHQIAPIRLSDSPQDALRRIEAVVRAMPRARIVSSEGDYLHAEFRSLLLGFVDDVEFQIDEAAGYIHFRSASRVGHSDLGTNRRRMEQIRSKLQHSDSR